jgi:hypothetical protein
MKQQGKKLNVSGLLTLLLFAVFGVCILSVLLTGADAYRRLRERDQSSYSRRTAAQYIATKVRQADGMGKVYAASFDGVRGEGDTLFLEEEIDGTVYCTRIYCHEGYIRELFAEVQGEFSPEDGEKILKAEEARFALQDGLLTVELSLAEGEREELSLFLRSGEVAS